MRVTVKRQLTSYAFRQRSIDSSIFRRQLADNIITLFRTLDAFRVFDLIYVLTGGGPGGTTESISLYAYKVMFAQTRFGYGSAMVLIMAIAVGLITLVYIKLLNVQLIGD